MPRLVRVETKPDADEHLPFTTAEAETQVQELIDAIRAVDGRPDMAVSPSHADIFALASLVLSLSQTSFMPSVN